MFMFMCLYVSLKKSAIHILIHHLQEAFYGRPVIEADRELVESGSDEILAGADKADIAFLVVGDPFGYASYP